MTALGKILAVDYGSKNVGIACCDDLRITVHPLPSLPNQGKSALLRKLKALLNDCEIREIVIGMPLHMNGTSGDAAQKVQNFMRALDLEFSLPVHPFDERLSTVEALDLWKDMNARQHRKYRTVDSLAAALILERYLRET